MKATNLHWCGNRERNASLGWSLKNHQRRSTADLHQHLHNLHNELCLAPCDSGLARCFNDASIREFIFVSICFCPRFTLKWTTKVVVRGIVLAFVDCIMT